MTNTYPVETPEVYQLKRELERVKAEQDMFKCYKVTYEKRINRLKEAQRKADIPFNGYIECLPMKQNGHLSSMKSYD